MNSALIPSEIARSTYWQFLKSIVFKIAVGFFSIGLLTSVTVRPTMGAERISISYGALQRSIPIESLETYARTGKIDDELAAYAQYAGEQQLSQLREVLLTPIPLGPVEVSQFLYTPIGERLLEILGEVIQQESGLSGFYAIRASLILAAADPQEGLTLLNVLRKFPSRSVSINLSRSLDIADAVQDLVNQTQQVIAQINRQSRAEAIAAAEPEDASMVRDLLKPGKSSWETYALILRDPSRNRTFPIDIYLPLVKGPHPVIVISHGLGSDRASFVYLASHLASHGFVVAVPEHPGSNAQQLQALLEGKAYEVTNPREFIDRPLDIKYLLDELARLSRSQSALQGRLNLQEVGVIGQSFGGYTALALAGAEINFGQLEDSCNRSEESLNVSLLLQCLATSLGKSKYDLSDPRVKAVIAINPIDSVILGEAGLSQIKIPVMIVAGSEDTVAPALPEQFLPFTWLTTKQKYLAVINGGTHFSTIAESPQAAVPLPEQVIGANPALARRYIQVLGLAFFETYVADELSYRQYLNPAYINALSQEPLPLSLVRSLNLDGVSTIAPSSVIGLQLSKLY